MQGLIARSGTASGGAQRIALVASVLALGGCLEDAGKTATENVKEASVSLQRGMTDVANAAPKIDPLALKALVEGNAELRSQVEYLRTRLNGLGTLGGVTEVSPDQRVFLQVTSHEGSVRIVDIYVDTENAWVMRNKTTPNTSAALPDLGPIAANHVQNLAVRLTKEKGYVFDDYGRDIRNIVNRPGF